MRGYLSLTVVGNLGQDPEMRYTPEGKAVTEFSVACNIGRAGEDGKEPPPVWVRVSAWEKLGELCNEYLQAGQMVLVVGRPRAEGWADKAGRVRAALVVTADKVVFLSPKVKGAVEEVVGAVEEAVVEVGAVEKAVVAGGGVELPDA